ncbi:uncharacterized protein HNQ56_002530 [Anaerotaenia torta]|uniref:ATP-dependent sacrificial sulfur transferase LarE n=1 Tax=Anaerotaenia torta TaxID=433293 RepID=UPI003D25AA14
MSDKQKKNENKDIYLKLALHMREHADEGIAIAFSGGVDSSLLLKVACDIGSSLEQPVLAVTFKTKLHPQGELQTAKAIASKYGALHKIILVDEFSDPEIVNNPIDRCYRCKSLLFRTLTNCAEREGYHYLVDGTNYDDKNSYRPGMKALEELGIHSPLLELEITKAQIRSLAADLGILSSNRPSAPCLATRLPYGTKLDTEILAKLDRGESFLREVGFYNVRLRLHGDIVRVEVDQEDFIRMVEHREACVSMLKDMGFHYITMDMEGFRSGSMDINIPQN